MLSIPASITRAFGQLGDPAILKVLVKTIAITLVILAIAGALAWQGALWAFASYDIPYGEQLGGVLGVLAFLIGGWLLFRLIALAVLQFFADEIVQAVEVKHYPDAAEHVRSLPWSEELSNALGGLGRAVLANLAALPFAAFLLFTGIGTALVFWAVNAWLLGRELQDMVWLRHRASADEPPPLGTASRFLLGGAIAGMMFVPFLNLLAPIIGAAAATHMVHRSRLPAKGRI
ncbi:EI24 domain-containing protein [Sphingomonadaceae bacterium]|nr:EI24 domain-containing protein [Sphingomonadaceae bacterium]